MKNYRTWGKPPYNVAVVHGGPGAPGSMAPAARELSKDVGVLEPLQTKMTIEEQVQELTAVLKEQGDLPVTLIGWSWGAILSYLTAAQFPDLVKKLIMLGTPALDPNTSPDLTAKWLERLSEKERVKFLELERTVWGGAAGNKSVLMGELFRLIARAESFDPIPPKDETLEYQLDVNIAIGMEMHKLLGGGKWLGRTTLLKMGKLITCPVVAIQGDYDPRPGAAVKEPLKGVVKNFKFISIEKCGHYPWTERYAREKFFQIIKEEIS